MNSFASLHILPFCQENRYWHCIDSSDSTDVYNRTILPSLVYGYFCPIWTPWVCNPESVVFSWGISTPMKIDSLVDQNQHSFSSHLYISLLIPLLSWAGKSLLWPSWYGLFLSLFKPAVADDTYSPGILKRKGLEHEV